MRTTGLGGDPEVHLIQSGLDGGLRLGPRRLIPVSLLAQDHGAMVHAALDRALSTRLPANSMAALSCRCPDRRAGCRRGRKPFWRGSPNPCSMARPITSRLEVAAMDRPVARGLVMIAGVTPSDASHVLGRLDALGTGRPRKRPCA